MATSRTNPTQPTVPTVLVVGLADAEAQLKDRVTKGQELITPHPDSQAALRESRTRYYTWDEYNTTLLKTLFSTTEIADRYSFSIGFAGGEPSLRQEIDRHVRDVESHLRQLSSIIEQLPLYSHRQTPESTTAATRLRTPDSRSVFIVHGRAGEAKNAVARCLTQLELAPIILHEQANEGLTIIEKVERHADVLFAVVLLTADDVGHIQPATSLESLYPRARQNVIFEWGYFVALLGRSKVCALVDGDIELPSDMHGIVWVPLDDQGAWKIRLVKELKAAGIAVDSNKVF